MSQQTERVNNEPLLTELESFFSALADRTRLEIVLLLLRKEGASVQDMVKELGKSQSLISHHLSCLRNCGIVKMEKRGKFSVYTLNGETVKDIMRTAIDHVGAHSKSILACDVIREEGS
ncbi:MAG: metalloregulator ArsR/SmtB family transcription factor [Metallosphaera yellowstonensis]|jgi:DNA-binding transcriptional ArsR family regulator|uniref:Putative transcriptional regulator n=1 Tax=Metallosphaera yellowstonensis MK1 TaxID=671065 RepID=H2C1S3_9CREN|nr:metalloregulator ArsR/SmtB family transcription factor [Metallosphaera yellowstonensis]EHP70194.1 putative transcriptional regulator [Metallosphaera yellowstonensis MK1]